MGFKVQGLQGLGTPGVVMTSPSPAPVHETGDARPEGQPARDAAAGALSPKPEALNPKP